MNAPGRAHSLAFAALIAVAAWLRLHGLDWDQGQHLHPDERFLTMVETALELPHSISEYFDTERSPLNPANQNYKFFVYGTLPLFLVQLIGRLTGYTDYNQIHFVGRVLSALFDVGTVWLTYRIGLRIGTDRVALAAAALVALSVTSIQNAHFFTVDSASAFFATLTLAALVRVAEGASLRWYVAFGVAFGLMLGCRVNLAVLGPIYLVGIWIAWSRGRRLAGLAGGSIAAGVVAALTFRVVQPYAFAGPGFFDVMLAPTFVSSLRQVRDMVVGDVDFPPSVQWIGRRPVLFAARNLLVWGVGPAWGLAAAIGVGWCIVRRDGEEKSRLARLAMLWGVLLFGYLAWQFAPTGRYFLPTIPVLALGAATWLTSPGARERPRLALYGIILVATAFWALAFTAIYRRPMTRVEASRWIYHNVPAGTGITSEHWDDALPLGLRDSPRIPYRIIELHLFDDDTASKRRELVDQLADADYAVLSSNRLYRSIPRTPWKYPMTRRYYELLFAGDLGFRLEQSFTSYPRLGPFEIPDDDAEEAFTVYDHPHVLIFKKTEAFSREAVEQLLKAVPLTGIQRVSPRLATALYRQSAPTDIPLPHQEGVRTAVETEETTFGALARWVLALEVLSIASFLVLFAAMPAAPDRGYGLGKIVGWLVPGYFGWLLCSTGLGVNTPATVRSIALVLATLAALAAWRNRASLGELWRGSRRELLAVEAVFWIGFAVFAAARSFYPAIYWGEKPMDFAFLNAITRSRTMPPADPWFAGGTLNYFYFGHALVAFFAKLAGVTPRFAFNLGVATVGGLLAAASYLAGRRLSGGILGGALAAVAVTLLGNLDGVRLLAADPHRMFDFNYFWATSRVIADTINEMPVWNLLFADLHAHVLAQPLEVTLVYLGLSWLRWPSDERPPSRGSHASRTSRWTVGVLIVWLLGAVGTTSAWSVPTAVVLQLAFVLTAWREDERPTFAKLVVLLGAWVALVAASRLLFWPFWASYTTPTGRGIGWETNRAPLADVLTIFGAFLIALLPLAVRAPGPRTWLNRLPIFAGALLVAAVGLWRGPAAGLFAAIVVAGALAWWSHERVELRVAGLLVAAAGGLGLMTEIFYVWDRMNTVFKYYLEMWLLLGCAAGGMLPVLWRRMGRARVVWAGGLAVAVAACGFTAASGAAGLLRFPFVASRIPTLDGTDYLRQSKPAEHAAYRWVERNVEGVPVMLEAQGDAYGEFGRVSMNTGLPTVLGWEYHLFQQAHSWAEIHERSADVKLLYSTPDTAVAERLMNKYHVDLVFVGPLERRTYPAAGLAKFASWPHMRPVFQGGEVTIYATPGVLRTTKTWIEPVESQAGSGGVQPGVYLEPRDVARAPDGSVYVADFGNKRIQHVGADLHPLAAIGRPGGGPGQFRDPCGIAVGADGSVYVADTWNHRVQKLDPSGAPIDEWAIGFYGPRGIALDRKGRIFVTDTGNHRIVRLAADGKLEREWGKGELDNPVGIAIGNRDELYVADAQNRRVVVYDLDGKLLRQWPIEGWQPSTLVEPYLDVGPDGVVWVTDPSGNRVLLFDAQGRPLGAAVPAGKLAIPLGIAVLDGNRAVVANAGSHSLVLVSRTASTSVEPER